MQVCRIVRSNIHRCPLTTDEYGRRLRLNLYVAHQSSLNIINCLEIINFCRCQSHNINSTEKSHIISLHRIFFLFNLIHKTDESLIAIFCSSQYLFRWIDDCVSMISCCWAQMRHSCTAEMIPFSSCLYSEWYSGMSVSIHCLLYVRRHHIYSFIANYKLQFYIYYYECRTYVI